MNKKDLIAYRDYHADDKNFILSSWMKGLYHGNSWFKDIDRDIYNTYYHQILEDLLKRPTIFIKMACLKDDPLVCLAYAVFENHALHYVFTKPIWRKIGLAKDLIPGHITEITHITTVGKAIWKEKYPHLKFNPFII